VTTDWREEQLRKRQEQQRAMKPLDLKEAKDKCPLCALDIRRVLAFYAEFHPDVHLYTCAMWKDVYHAVSTSFGDELGKVRLVRAKVEKNG
jgi:hypothetical protein